MGHAPKRMNPKYFARTARSDLGEHGREMGSVVQRPQPLHQPGCGAAQGSDLATGPGLRAGPFLHLGEILPFLWPVAVHLDLLQIGLGGGEGPKYSAWSHAAMPKRV